MCQRFEPYGLMVDLRFCDSVGLCFGHFGPKEISARKNDVFSQLNAPTHAPLICQLSSIHSFKNSPSSLLAGRFGGCLHQEKCGTGRLVDWT